MHIFRGVETNEEYDIPGVVQHYANQGLDVHLTELDVRTYEERLFPSQADTFRALTFACLTISRGGTGGRCSAITVWGTSDDSTYHPKIAPSITPLPHPSITPTPGPSATPDIYLNPPYPLLFYPVRDSDEDGAVDLSRVYEPSEGECVKPPTVTEMPGPMTPIPNPITDEQYCPKPAYYAVYDVLNNGLNFHPIVLNNGYPAGTHTPTPTATPTPQGGTLTPPSTPTPASAYPAPSPEPYPGP